MDEPRTLRLFVAGELPAEVRATLIDTQGELRRERLPVSWVAPEAMHLTLRFLGETPAAQLPALRAALGDALAGRRAPLLHLTRVGAFPDTRRPNVAWAGVGGDLVGLQGIYAALEAALAARGIAPEGRSFHPHLTLGRVRRSATAEQRARLGALIAALPPYAPGRWPLSSIALFRSELRRGGPLYTALETVALW